MNSIDAKGIEFLQVNMPGNDGYGQPGSKGDEGKQGNCVYFSAFRDSTEMAQLINDNKELSNNPEYEQNEVQYKSNDYIIDSAGNINMLKFKSQGLNFVYMGNIFSSGTITNHFTCTVHVNNIPDSSHYYKIDNINYRGAYNDNSSSPYLYHRDRYNEKICGFWITFNTFVGEDTDYMFKYVIVLPNGLKIENIASTSSYEMFFDNRLLYGCVFENMTELKTEADFHSIDNNKENTYTFTRALASKMNECTIYVDISDKNTGKIYRIYPDIIIEDIE